ncbi:type II 3-dehydroquinate dehydratase, partial [Streptomyces sp. P9(2023)]|uniref:type II 3-dehydroquinate dehydratase n=1 Tax=Streptomyces sp. P9(2023) TaxID=3064394 RepID=UPI0028F44AC2
IIINPAAYTHTSVAILDALNAFDGKVIEVHLSNVHKREAFRHHSYVSLRADGVIAGLGIQGYRAALDAIIAV